jgi:hypothetical protein
VHDLVDALVAYETLAKVVPAPGYVASGSEVMIVVSEVGKTGRSVT